MLDDDDMPMGVQADIDFLKNPRQWPGRVCCVKNYTRTPHAFGYVKQNEDGTTMTKVIGESAPHDTNPPTEQFGSVEEMVDAGWIVD